VGDGRGKRAKADDDAHAQRARQLDDVVGERGPLEVGLGTDEEQHVVAAGVLPNAQLHAWPVETFMNAFDDPHDRTAGPAVDQLVAVESRQRVGVALAQQGGHRRGAAETGVDPTLEAHHERGRDRIGFEVALV
jgi:hypothetical protein